MVAKLDGQSKGRPGPRQVLTVNDNVRGMGPERECMFFSFRSAENLLN